jgi:hypothetical protein
MYLRRPDHTLTVSPERLDLTLSPARQLHIRLAPHGRSFLVTDLHRLAQTDTDNASVVSIEHLFSTSSALTTFLVDLVQSAQRNRANESSS